MVSYIIRRLLLMIPTLLGISLLVYLLMALAPGAAAAVEADIGGELGGSEVSRARLIEIRRKRLGLDLPIWQQWLLWANQLSPVGVEVKTIVELRYDPELGNYEDYRREYGGLVFKAPSLGNSSRFRTSCWEVIAGRLPVTLMLNVMAIPIIYILAIYSGVYAARYRGTPLDTGTGTLMLALWSLPVILVGQLMIMYICNEAFSNWFPARGLSSDGAERFSFLPTSWPARDPGASEFLSFMGAWSGRGWLLDRIWHMVLPVLCLSYAGVASVSKLTRTATLENLHADFARTARAKGVSEPTLLWHHVFRNSLLPLITIAGNILPGLLAGAVVVETIFTIPGMGTAAIDAVFSRDRELVLAITMMAGVVTLVSNLLVDICYAFADPRVSYD